MSIDGDICWKRTFAGRNPSHVFVVGTTVVFSYIDNQGDPGSPGRHRAVCLDLDGGERWSVRDFELHAAVPGERLLGTTASGDLRVLDLNGRNVRGVRNGAKEMRIKRVSEVRETCKRVLVKTNDEVIVTDLALNMIGRFAPPPQRSAVVIDDALLYVEGQRIVRRDRHGDVKSLCQIPTELALDAMTRFERETGRSALHGNWKAIINRASGIAAAIDDPAKPRPFAVGERPPGGFFWALSYVEPANALFVSNVSLPHVLICLGLDGTSKWSTYLSSGCCGGDPACLPSGELVISSGCGGILSWLDPAGRILRRTTPHDGEGLATAYSSHVSVLADSSCVVNGGPGIVSYAADGTLRWVCKEYSSCFDYCEGPGLLVTASWSGDDRKTVTVTCIKNLGERAARA